MANRIIFILCLVFFTSICFAQSTDTNQALKEETSRARAAVTEISKYISRNKFCFEYTDKCKEENQEHVDNMVKYLVERGWGYKDYNMRMELTEDTTGKKYMLLGVSFRSFVNPNGAYHARWTVKQIVEKKSKSKSYCIKVIKMGFTWM
jgi:hypothetical protein